jgi:carboxypeptidase C (cathepsin A)
MVDEGMKDGKPAAKAEHEPPAGAQTAATWTGAGVSIDYTASARWIVLRRKEKPAAEIFSVSYVADRDTDRPVTFVFNGGPGASSAYLHMGALGPLRVAFPADGTLPRLPPRLVSNEESWLAFTDLVFVDPVGTGFSRVIEDDGKDPEDKKKPGNGDDGEAREYFGYKRDLESLCEFMGRWLSGQGRWGSAVLIAGEYRAQRRGADLPGA